MLWISLTDYSKRRGDAAWMGRALGWMLNPSSGGLRKAPTSASTPSVGACLEHDPLRPARYRENVAHRHACSGGCRESGSR